MSEGNGKRRRFRFGLRSLLLWVIPWAALCSVVMTSCREPMLSPGQGLPMFHWTRIAACFVITAVWAVLLWENARASSRQREERDVD